MVGSATQQLYEYLHPATGCAKCPSLVNGRHTIVWGKGPAQAEQFWIGEAPGYNEDLKGLPFVGKAGQELYQLSKEAGINMLEDCHIGNVLMCRPPGNRDPEPEEVANCSPWLTEHVRTVSPKVIVCFGRYAITRYFDRGIVAETQGLMWQIQCDGCGGKDGQHLQRFAEGGQWIEEEHSEHNEVRRLVAAIYHPAATFGNRNPGLKADIIHQLKRVKAEIAASREGGTT